GPFLFEAGLPEMTVKVDEARHHEAAFRVHDLGSVSFQVGTHCGHVLSNDKDVQPVIDVVLGIDDPAAPEQRAGSGHRFLAVNIT
ncbi:MAG: hypothetical protein ACE5EF_08020, partial [Dehalococcoidia bacterium]